LTRTDYDIQKDTKQDLRTLFKENNVNKRTVVINAAGLIPHAGTFTVESYDKINTKFPKTLSEICEEFGAELIHPTTDCVYSGNEGNYNERSTHDVLSEYGQSKSKGENINATIIRTSIIGENKKKISLIEWIKSNKGKKVFGYTNHYWNGITCLQYAKIIWYIISKGLFWKGVRHVFSPTVVSKAELIKMVNDEYNLQLLMTEIGDPVIMYESTDPYVKKCDRSLNSVYDFCNSLNIPELREQIHEMSHILLD
jgi:dTDP-4-dehydrorhamnose reductase